MRCVVACVLVGLAMANPEVEELRAQIRALSAQNAKLEAAVDAMKTLSPETKRQVAVELSAAKSCVATDPKASCELVADTGAPPAKPESNLGEPLQARISSKDKGSGFDWTQCKSEVCCPFPCPPSTPHDVSCDFLPGCVCFYP